MPPRRRTAGIRRGPIRPIPPQSQKKSWDFSKIATVISSLTAVGALIFTSLSLRAAQRQIEITEQGQVTERFNKAVEQIANVDNMEIRLSGIYALGRIARDSARDHDEVSRLLAAFVRRKRAAPERDGPEPCAANLGHDDVDVTEALEFVSRQETGPAPDLRATCLTGSDLKGARLHCAVLDSSYLYGTTELVGVDLSWASLASAHFFLPTPDDPQVGVSLEGADLSHARLNYAQLQRAYLAGANLSGADLSDADLDGVDLSNANLRGAHLLRADLTEAKFPGADITGATFTDSATRDAALAQGAKDTGHIAGNDQFTESDRCVKHR